MKSIICFVFAFVLFVSVLSFQIGSFDGNDYTPIVPTNENLTCESNYSCATEGDTCADDVTCDATAGTCCAVGLRCVNTTCATDNVEGWCTSNADCFSNYEHIAVSCVNNSCYLQYAPGDECDEDVDCITGNCNDDGICEGQTEGQDCLYNAGDATSNCNYGLNCKLGSCVNSSSLNETCSTTTDCEFGLICLQGKTCIEAFSLEENDDCDLPKQCDTDLVCYKGKCVEGQEWESDSCDNSGDCDDNEGCFCSLYSGDKVCLPVLKGKLYLTNFTNSNDDTADLYECARENECTHISNAPNACTQQNCKSDVEDSQGYTCDVGDAIYDSCSVYPECGGFPVWAIIVIAVVAVILVLVIIVVAVMAMKRKRNEYDSI